MNMSSAKIIFDELSILDAFEDASEDLRNELVNEEFNNLFNNEYAKKRYIVAGSIGLWDGKRYGYSTKIANSIKEAIQNATDGFGICYIRVEEEKYGKLFVTVSHHDGNNFLEIREITNYGEEILNSNYDDVDSIINRKGATRNVKFYKRYF